jgi:NADPH:quinone reductase-like Zn-dependent oxidoreductase
MSNHTVTTAYDTESARGTARVHGPATAMKAWQIGRFGLEALEQIERRTPQPGPHELLVRVGAASLNFRDRLVIDGTFLPDLALPFVPASDGAGEVVAVGKDVTRFRVGDRVIGTYIPKWIDGDGHGPDGDYVSRGGPLPGVLAEYVAFDEHAAVPTPSYLTDREASTLPIAAVTAWTALFEHGRLRPGETVLVEGTGGVALFGIQIAKLHGARVIVSGSADKLERALTLGADHGVDRRQEDWVEAVLAVTGDRGADHVMELVGGSHLGQAIRITAVGGHVYQIGALDGFEVSAPVMPLMLKDITIHGIATGHRRALTRLVDAVDRTGLTPTIDTRYPLTELHAALDHLDRGAFGKIVVEFE